MPPVSPATASAEPPTDEPPTKRVLVITSYDLNRPAVNIASNALRATIRDGSKGRVEFFYEILETTRIPVDKYEDEMAGYLRRKYEGEEPDLVIALGAPALKTLLKHEPELFTDTPKIFCFYDEREETVHALWPHVTGVRAEVDSSRTLEVALALQPETQRVVVVTGNSPQDKFLREQAQSELRRYEGRIEFTYLNDLTLEELKARLATLPEKTVVLYLAFFLDSAGNSYSGPEVLSMFAPTSSAPVYGISETYMGAGIVGGSLINFEALGKRTGEMGLRILSGEKPGDIIPQTPPNLTVFDWRELRRRGLSERELPPGSVVRFKEPTFWELYEWYIVGVTAACIIEALLIAWLLIVQRRRRRAERERERFAGLVEAEHRHLDEVVSNVPGIVWETLVDPDTNTRRTNFISDYVEKMLGYTADEWLSAKPGFGLSIMPEADREVAARVSEEVMATGRGAVTQFRWRTKGGRLVWVETHMNPIVDERGKVVGLRGVSIDITDKKLAEETRSRSEERSRAILRASPDLMFLQTRDGVYLDYHAKDPKDLLVPPEEFLGKNVRDMMPPELAERFVECFGLALETGEPQLVEYELTLQGEVRWYEARIVGSGENVLSVVRDITGEKQSQEAVRESEERFRATFEQAAVGVAQTTPDGRWLLLNQKLCEIVGYTREELLAKTFREITYAEDLEENLEYLRRQLAGEIETFSMEKRYVRKDGSPVWVNLTTSLVRDEATGEPLYFIVIVEDISERKRAEESLRESEERYRTLFESIDEGFTVFDVIFDDEGGPVDLFFRVTNPAFERQTGWRDAVGRRARELAPDLEEVWYENYARVAATGEPVRFTERAAPLNGWYEVYAFRVGEAQSRTVAVIFSDVTERVRAEDALRRSEAVLAHAGRMASLGAWEVDLSHAEDIDENPLVWSDEVYHIYGYEPGSVEVSSELFFRHVHPDDRRRVRQEIRAAHEGKRPYQLEHRIVRADGAERVVQEHAAFDVDETGRPRRIIGAVQDITERKAADEALRQSEGRLRRAQEAARVGTWEWDVRTGVSVWSEMVWQLLGLEPGDGETTHKMFLTFVHPEDRDRFTRKVNKVIAEGEDYYNEYRIVRRDGGVIWLSSSGRVICSASGQPERFIGVSIDITERKLAEEALRQSEERFRNMADTAPVLIWMAGADKLCYYVNKQWLDFTGRSMDEELGDGWAEGIHPDDYARCIEIYTSSFDRREPFQMEYRLRRADDAYRWVFDTGTPRLSSGGEFLGYIGSCVDIHDRKESEVSLHKVMEELNRLKNQLHEENIYLREEIKQEHNFSEIVGGSDAVKYVLHKIEQVAPTDATVLIMGETGTGKELVARAIHSGSPLRERPLVKVNCAALAPGLIESELFGHEKGAFTGAAGRKIGRFELADGATIFLDEIGELPTDLQVKLLRVIQEGEFERLGGNRTIKVDVRIIAATNRNLWQEVQAGNFREDLWYRLNVFPISVPPLRQRRADIPLLVEHFTNSFAKKMGKRITSVAPSTLGALRDYLWPGNVRELANVIERAVINSNGPTLQISNFAESSRLETPPAAGKTLEEMEREYIVNILDSTGWRIEGPQGAARLLGLNPSTLRTRMIKLGIQKPQVSSA